MSELAQVDLVNRAFTFASAAHYAVGQKRKYTGEDYIVHPVEVARLVASIEGHTPEMLAAALLHDVVEDTQVTLQQIEAHFGPEVMNHVSWLTDISKPGDGNRETRKRIDREHTWLAPKDSQSIKACDLISNTIDITKADPHFAVVYMREKRLLLEGMNADEGIMARAWKLVRDYDASRKGTLIYHGKEQQREDDGLTGEKHLLRRHQVQVQSAGSGALPEVEALRSRMLRGRVHSR